MLAKLIMEKRQQVNKLVTDVRSAMDKADTEKRSLDQAERNSIEAMETEIDNLESDIALREKQLARERSQNAEPPAVPGAEERTKPRSSEEYRSAFTKFFNQGQRAIYSDVEQRAMQGDNALSGGMFMAPEQYVSEVVKDIDNNCVIEGLARTFDINMSESLGVPTLDQDVDDADWTAEIQAAAETQDLKFGERELTPHQISKLVKLSNKLINGSTMPIEQFVRERLGYKFGITQEKVFIGGDGSQKPLGLFTPSANGISTAFDISNGNTATGITVDGLMEALYDMKEGYQRKSTWLFHRLAIKQIRKLKDGNGQYLWQAGLAGGQPPTILDRPYVQSEYVPSTFTTGQYVGIIGDFSYYWIVRRYALAIQVLKELYAPNNQTGYIGRLEVDAMPVLGNAFRRVKLG